MKTAEINYNLSQWVMSDREFAKHIGFNTYRLHQIISDLFDESCQFEIESRHNNQYLLIKSNNMIKKQPIVGELQTKKVNIIIEEGSKYTIKCNLNATKNISNGKKNGKRVPYVGDTQIAEWFNKKSESFGIAPIDLKVGKSNNITDIKNPGQVITWSPIELRAAIQNAELFATILRNGIGDSRKFGCGLVKLFY